MVAGPYLVDTSTLIWVLADSKRLSAKARKALHAGPLVLSVVSFWEIVLKAQKGSLDIADPVHWWSRATDLSGGVILSIRPAHISEMCIRDRISETNPTCSSACLECPRPIDTIE